MCGALGSVRSAVARRGTALTARPGNRWFVDETYVKVAGRLLPTACHVRQAGVSTARLCPSDQHWALVVRNLRELRHRVERALTDFNALR